MCECPRARLGAAPDLARYRDWGFGADLSNRTSAGRRGDFGLTALRRGGIARAAVALGTSSLTALYVAPLALAFALPPAAAPGAVHPLAVPTIRFPALDVPSLTRPAKAARPAPKPFLRVQRAPVKSAPVQVAVPGRAELDSFVPKPRALVVPAAVTQPLSAPVVRSSYGTTTATAP